jgi:tRNA/tmRNA/rRNA uracil-C5-methylase (TrmA/RlmC/RlmD family)
MFYLQVKKKKKAQPGIVAHSCNPRTLQAEAGRYKLEASMDYTAKT